jgi:hypothetical protein
MSDYEQFSNENTTDSELEIIPYYEANKTTISVQKKDYYKKNRDKILQKIKCECGRYICKNQMVRHKKTKVHETYLNLLNKEKNLDNEIMFN